MPFIENEWRQYFREDTSEVYDTNDVKFLETTVVMNERKGSL